ncbi:hypothetical protein [Ruminococcus flavefaciens]|uniref:hypothetical protein n=2 Tax=Ruminococcus TaxID=1263 RepID=UPI0026EA3DE2|nr:hypothetical protein [Ruminococcus flavefaciens]MDD7516616.1 hypothetical protein [Ruminococcus flavefaciens]MDY5690632.1 hypothetical protein [Ruminococcus flavefaciens]
MELGTRIVTPRFCTVTISAIFENPEDAVKCGYTEPTHAVLPEWDIKGKSIDMYHMEFAAIRKGEWNCQEMCSHRIPKI